MTPAARSAALKIGPEAPASNVLSKSKNAAPRWLLAVSFTLAGYWLAVGTGQWERPRFVAGPLNRESDGWGSH